MSHISLRIKKIYFDAIMRGEKTAEYRSVTARYRAMLIKDPKITEITFHYQSADRLTCKVKSIKEIKRPDFIPPDIVSDPCFKIQLCKPIRYWKKKP